MKELNAEQVQRVNEFFFALPLASAAKLALEAVPGGSLPYLDLPEGSMEFDQTRGFWGHFKCLLWPDGQPHLLLCLNSYCLAEGAGHSWAIPMGPPRSPRQALLHELEMFGGWELSTFELAIQLDGLWRPVLEDVLRVRRLGVRTKQARSLFPMKLTTMDLEELRSFLEGS
jgi:hypothetical protein